MINIQMGTVTGYNTGDFLNIKNVQVLQVTVEGEPDATPALLINPAMDESAPKNGERVAILKLGNFAIAIGGIDGIAPETAQGEKRLYSRDGNGDIAAFLFLLSSGIMQLNGTGDFLARFNELESGFNTLKSDHNSFLTHVHGPAGSPPVPVAPPSTASISSAKIEEIEVPGVTP